MITFNSRDYHNDPRHLTCRLRLGRHFRYHHRSALTMIVSLMIVLFALSSLPASQPLTLPYAVLLPVPLPYLYVRNIPRKEPPIWRRTTQFYDLHETEYIMSCCNNNNIKWNELASNPRDTDRPLADPRRSRRCGWLCSFLGPNRNNNNINSRLATL